MKNVLFTLSINDGCLYVTVGGFLFPSNPAARSSVWPCSFSEVSSVCGVFSADPSLSTSELCTRDGFGERSARPMSRTSRLVVVATSESLKMVFEKTEVKVNMEPRRDSCTGALWCFVRTTAGSLGGFAGGTSSGSPLLLESRSWLRFSVSSCAQLSSDTWAGSALTLPLQSLLTLERRDEPSAVEMTLLERGRPFGDLNSFSCPSFMSGVEKQLRQPDMEDDFPWTYSTVIGEYAEARVVSFFRVIPLSSELILPTPPVSDERRATLPLALRMVLVPLVSQKSWDSTRSFSFCTGWVSELWTLAAVPAEAFSLCCCSFICRWGVEASVGGW